MDHTNRVVVLVDMDCFYCQVEEKLDPQLKGKPIAVVQYNAWRGGGIIAVNYVARDRGVSRHERGEDAQKKCPDIQLVKVPQVRGKADLSKYREAGKLVADVLQTFTPLLERASVDEAYLDITEAVNKRAATLYEPIPIDKVANTHVVGSNMQDFLINSFDDKLLCERNHKLAIGGLIAEEIRAAVYEKTGYRCSAGIAHNKILAKVTCGLHKPNQQTILPQDAVPVLFKDLPLRKIRNLGGKFGQAVGEKLKIEKMGDLERFTERELSKYFDEKTSNWLYNIARGIDTEPVTIKLISKSIGCCKRFPGKTSLIQPEDVEHWMGELAEEIAERLEKDMEENNRRAKQVIVSFSQMVGKKDVSSSRTQNLSSYDQCKIKQIGMDVLRRFCLKPDGKYHVTFLGLSVGNFEENKNVQDITSFFKNVVNNKNKVGSGVDAAKKMVDKAKDREEDAKDHEDEAKEQEYARNENHDAENKQDKADEEENEDSCSIYSASTEDLNEDLDNLIYYDDVISRYKLDKSADSISGEINEPCTSERPPSNSFFKRYFDNLESRSFDTSKMLIAEDSCDILISYENTAIDDDDGDDDDDDGQKECPECGKSINTDDMQSHIDYHYALKIVKEETHLYRESPKPPDVKTKTKTKSINEFMKESLGDNNTIQDDVEKCPDCNKNIPLTEMQSHMDYHFALKLVKEDSHLYTPQQQKPKEEKRQESKKGKRKHSDTKTGGSIKLFFTTEQLTEENSIRCDLCCKKIRVEDYSSHMDFHEARKVQRELNVNRGCGSAGSSKKSSLDAFFKQ